MKLTRLLFTLGLGVILVAGPGCRQNTVVIPTDEDAKKRAAEGVPPPSKQSENKDFNPPGVKKDSPFGVKGVGGDSEKK